MNNGNKIIAKIKLNNDPITVNLTASYPIPFINNLWPGKTPKAVSASGAPKNIAGRTSRKVWVIAIDIIKTPREGKEKISSK